jgi:hypothetical protein
VKVGAIVWLLIGSLAGAAEIQRPCYNIYWRGYTRPGPGGAAPNARCDYDDGSRIIGTRELGGEVGPYGFPLLIGYVEHLGESRPDGTPWNYWSWCAAEVHWSGSNLRFLVAHGRIEGGFGFFPGDVRDRLPGWRGWQFEGSLTNCTFVDRIPGAHTGQYVDALALRCEWWGRLRNTYPLQTQVEGSGCELNGVELYVVEQNGPCQYCGHCFVGDCADWPGAP